MIEVKGVRTRADRRAWLNLPYRLYAEDPLWVPPLKIVERRRWSPRHNPSLDERVVRRFLARQAGKVVGRVATVVDPSFQRWEPGAGFFGFFEAIDDADVAGALLRAAEADLTASGARCSFGPVNLSTHDEVGLLVDGYDRPPTLLSPYNPPGYARLLEASGYQPARDYHAYGWTPEVRPRPAAQRLFRRMESWGAAAGVRVRAARDQRWEDEVRLLHRLYNRCFSDLWGFVPIRQAEFAARAAEFRAFYRPELIRIAETDEGPVGMAIVLPDPNPVLASLGGRLLPFGWLRLTRAVKRLDTARFLLLGVTPELRGRGVAALLIGAVHRAGLQLGFREAELSLVQGDNRPMRHIIEAFDCCRVRTFRLYRKPLAP